jgi:hypothetical protein
MSGAAYLNYPKSEIAGICLLYGAQLELEGTDDEGGQKLPIVGSQLLFAIAGRESTFGANCKPRLEPAYDLNGRYFKQDTRQRMLYALFGQDAAKSWGPWQVMLCNAAGYKPDEMGRDPKKACDAAVKFLNRFVFGVRGARTLSQILDTYNSGTWRDQESPGVKEYIKVCTRFYFTEVISSP